MKTLAAQSTFESGPAGKVKVNTFPPQSALPEQVLIHRKAECACGGGCPACESKNANLPVSQPNDASEIEADMMADKVMRMSLAEKKDVSPAKNSVQRKKSSGDSISVAPPIVRDVINSSSGKSLDKNTRSFMEPRFNYDFGRVKIFDDNKAAESASSVNAVAYTWGSNIVFNSGQYNPDSDSGKQLLAHELAHVVQQGKNHSPSIQRRTFRDTFTTVAFSLGPVWRVHLTITHAPEGDSESLDNFITACHNGIMNAARSLGERPPVTTREIRVRIRFSRRLSEDGISQQAYDLAIASLPRPTAPVPVTPPRRTRPRVVHIPHDSSEDPRPGETDDQRIRREATASLRELSNVVADAGSEGFNRVVITIQNNGREIIPGFSKEEQAASPPSGDSTSAYSVRDLMRNFYDTIVQGSGRWQIVFTRQGNAMSFRSFQRIPEPATRGGVAMSEADELRALGIPDRREIYAHIFQETQRQLGEVAVSMAGFTIEQIVLYVAGGSLFRGITLLGRGATSAFPRLMAIISRGSSSAFASGLGVLNTAERAEFVTLMRRVESGVLSVAEQTRLRGFLTRIEAALPSTTSAAALMSRIRIPGITSLSGSRAAFDRELVRRAAEIRATQAGLTLDAFTSYNVAVARVRTASGEIVYLEAGNLPGAAHSEEYILGQLRDRATGLGAGARVEQIYSERIPCSNCGEVIRRFFGEGTEVYYTVGNQPNRGRLLMEAYGL